ncbi:metallophosphoesterase [Sporosarcina thermotolerans]|uniref:Metallophosphoesterase n=1 Tax=Sporosarcina thermotolerans TaxID=633404 RepID=A0AAW9A8I0_9BACL|nr:metallophosphoesterase [Sporosarcina thermotolerans]MDW0117502.1 metallophosphoesterase [Sporosarcina thermotolerans]
MVGVVFAFIIIISIYGSANYYIARKTYQWLRLVFPNIKPKLYTGIYIFIASSIILAFLPLPSGIKSVLGWISAYWMGVFAYLLLFILMANLILFIGSLLKLIPKPMPRSIHLYAGLAVFLLTTSIVSYGIYNATQIKHVSYDIQMEGDRLPEDINMVLISDLHLGAVNSEKRLESIVENINLLEPEIVTIAGDLFNDDYNAIKNPEKAIELLKNIKTKYGVYVSLGNHDGGDTFDEMVRFLEKSNITLLNDEHVIIDDKFILVGRVDPSPIGGFGGLQRKDIMEILTSINDIDLPIIVMDHTPSKLELYEDKIDLLLAGHTHRGQLFPGSLITNAIFEVDYGHYQKNATSPHVIVSSGVGTWGMPMRVGTNNEIVSINLRR